MKEKRESPGSEARMQSPILRVPEAQANPRSRRGRACQGERLSEIILCHAAARHSSLFEPGQKGPGGAGAVSGGVWH